jgi:hypothetical protein
MLCIMLLDPYGHTYIVSCIPSFILFCLHFVLQVIKSVSTSRSHSVFNVFLCLDVLFVSTVESVPLFFQLSFYLNDLSISVCVHLYYSVIIVFSALSYLHS